MSDHHVIGQPVLVEWEDPHSTGGWLDRDQAISDALDRKRLCRTVGWIVHQDDELLVLAGSIGDSTTDQIGDVFEVPRRTVNRIIWLAPTHTDVT